MGLKHAGSREPVYRAAGTVEQEGPWRWVALTAHVGPERWERHQLRDRGDSQPPACQRSQKSLGGRREVWGSWRKNGRAGGVPGAGEAQCSRDCEGQVSGRCPLLSHPPPAFLPGAAASWLGPVLLFPDAAVGFLATCSVCTYPLCLSHCPLRAFFSRHGRSCQ